MASGFLYAPPQYNISHYQCFALGLCHWFPQDFARHWHCGPNAAAAALVLFSPRGTWERLSPLVSPNSHRGAGCYSTVSLSKTMLDQAELKSSPKGESIWEGKAMSLVRWEMHKRTWSSKKEYVHPENIFCTNPTWDIKLSSSSFESACKPHGGLNVHPGVLLFTKDHSHIW